MEINVYDDKVEVGQAAAEKAAELLRYAIKSYGEATFVAATGPPSLNF